MNKQELKDKFLEILKSNVNREGLDDLIGYLEKSDFFDSPASSMYHNSFEGGLCSHSLNVYYALIYELETTFGEDWERYVNKESATLVALLHDICKTNTYEPYMRNIKNQETGQWEQVQSYKRNPKFPMGHGGKSVYLISNFIKLKPDEALAIFWHMGPYDTSNYNTWDENSMAWQKYPLAFLLFIADMKATYVLENEYGAYDEKEE